MDTLLQAGLSNAAAALGLALAVLAVGSVCRRPALMHGLWLLVLLMLLAPPLLRVPVALPAAAAPAAADEPAPVADDELLAALALLEMRRELPEPVPGPEAAEPADSPEAEAVPEEARAPGSWKPLLVGLWVAGSVAWFAVAGWRTWRFRRLLVHARPAPRPLARRVADLSARLGLARRPETWLVPGRLSPMLWALGGPARLYLPEGLLKQLTDEQRDTLLAHELAHLRRRDHWVRGLELVTTGLYWWHPAVWLARRELREAEEQCCDAWVLWALPGKARAYATALVETLDFLSGACPSVPPVASGVGPLDDLKRRLTMILRGTTPRELTWGGCLAVLALGFVLLPLRPTWAQEPRPEPAKAAPKAAPAPKAEIEIVIDLDDLPKELRDKIKVIELGQTIKGVNTDVLIQLADEKAKLKDKLKLAEVEAKGKIAGGGAAQAADIEKLRDEVARLKKELEERVARVREAEARLKELTAKLAAVQGGGAKGSPDTGKTERRVIILRSDDGKEYRLEVPSGADLLRSTERSKAALEMQYKKAETPSPAKAPAAGADRRMEDFEKRLDALMRELESLRRDMRGSGGRSGGGPPARVVPPVPPVKPVPPAPFDKGAR